MYPSIRLRLQVILATTIYGVVATVGLGMAIAPPAKFGVRLTGVGIFPAFTWLAVRASRAGALVLNGEITVRGWVKTRTFHLKDVERAYLGSGRTLAQQTPTMHLILKNGEDVALQAISTNPLWPGPSKVQGFVDQLNHVLSLDPP